MADRGNERRRGGPDAVVAGDSHAATPKPSGKSVRVPAPQSKAQKALDVPAAVPLHLRPVMTYAELAAVGIVPERTLRRLVAVGRVKHAVLRAGRRIRFVVQDLIDELRGVEG